MNKGFNNVNVDLKTDEILNIQKKYKKIKKYMKSSFYTVKKMDGTEEMVSKLIEEYNQNPID